MAVLAGYALYGGWQCRQVLLAGYSGCLLALLTMLSVSAG